MACTINMTAISTNMILNCLLLRLTLFFEMYSLRKTKRKRQSRWNNDKKRDEITCIGAPIEFMGSDYVSRSAWSMPSIIDHVPIFFHPLNGNIYLTVSLSFFFVKFLRLFLSRNHVYYSANYKSLIYIIIFISDLLW